MERKEEMRKILVCTLISVFAIGVTACSTSKSPNADKQIIDASVKENTTDICVRGKCQIP